MIFGGAGRGLGSIMLVTVILLWVYKYVIKGWTTFFQRRTLKWLDNAYERFLKFALRGKTPYYFTAGMMVMFVSVLFLYFGVSVASGRTKVEFFPENKPNQIIVYIEYPEGTSIAKTNRTTKDIETIVYEVLNDPEYIKDGENFLVESAVSQVGEGAGNPQTDGGSAAEMPNKGKITASMREYKYRNGKDSEVLRQKVQEAVQGKFPGIAISVEKDQAGPPTGYPVNIELQGED
jgi:multidrug efflux pump subunit AcrB